MNVFLSWSGVRSRRVAEIFYEMLPMMINAVRPFMSSEDVAKGSRWADEISRQLEGADVGIICLTSENRSEPWINFEAGAISKKVGQSLVFPFLLDFKTTELSGPLTMFQATKFDSLEVLKLFRSLNQKAGRRGINEKQLTGLFEKLWVDLSEELNVIKNEPVPQNSAAKSQDQLLEEILLTARTHQQQLSKMNDAISALSAAQVGLTRDIISDSLGTQRKHKKLEEASELLDVPLDGVLSVPEYKMMQTLRSKGFSNTESLQMTARIRELLIIEGKLKAQEGGC